LRSPVGDVPESEWTFGRAPPRAEWITEGGKANRAAMFKEARRPAPKTRNFSGLYPAPASAAITKKENRDDVYTR
jgi:hypothetical protein